MSSRQLAHVGVAAVCLMAVMALTGCPSGEVIRVTSTSPAADAVNVPLDSAISITFDRAAAPDTLDYEIVPESEIETSWSANSQTVTLTPALPMLAHTSYTVTIYDVEPAGGGSIDEEYSFSFTTTGDGALDYRQAMRNFVIEIAEYARQTDPAFIVIPQNGEALLTDNGTDTGTIAAAYIAAIDGQGREDVFYGYNADNQATPADVRADFVAMLELAEEHGVEALAIDYCSTHAYVDDSYTQNEALGFISFAAHRRDLDAIPTYPGEPHNVNPANVLELSDAQNLLYLLNPGEFASREAYLNALAATDYDLFIIDLFYDDALTAADLDALRTKAGGGTRLLIAYMSIGEAEDYRYYWQPAWQPGSPSFIHAENPDWEGNYKVRYWDPAWQAIIFGNEGAYLDRILAAGFDGVYLDIIDAYEYFEEQE